MAIHDYRCKKCNHEFEEYYRNKKEERGIICPSCSSKSLEKLMVATSKQFKNHIGKTLADNRIKDTMKRVLRAPNGGVNFTDKFGNIIG